MPDQEFKRTVSFDRDEIRAKITRYTFSEARRQRGPIYAAIVKELYENGCPTAAQHFDCLARKEETLISAGTIRARVSNETELLSTLVEHIKCAEKTYHMNSCNGHVVAFRLLYQCLQLLEPYGVTYNWLLGDVFVIISNICDKVKEPNDSTAEMIGKIYYKHGLHLSKTMEWSQSIKYLQKALSLARSSMWFVNEGIQQNLDNFVPTTLHEAVGQHLCKVLLKYAAVVGSSNATEAAVLAQQAVVTSAELGIDGNKNYFYCATIERSSYLITSGDKKSAVRLLETTYEELKGENDNELKKLLCKCTMYMGICYSSFNSDQMATEKFKESVLLSRELNWALLEAEVLVNMGKHLSKTATKFKLAKEAFEIARKIFTKLGDMNAVGQTSYLLCKLQAHEIMPYLMILLKNSENQFCDFINLRLWKTQVQPFWPNMQKDTESQDHDEIYCLLTARSEICMMAIKNPPTPTNTQRASKITRASKMSLKQ